MFSRQSLVISFSSLGADLVLSLFFWNVIDHSVIYLWLALSLTFVFLLPVAHYFMCFQNKLNKDNLRKFKRRYLVMSLIGGAAWGAAGVLFYTPGSIEHQVLLLLILAIGGALVTLMSTADKQIFYVQLFPIFIPIVIRGLIDADNMHLFFAMFIVPLYIATLIYFNRNAHLILLEALTLRFENSSLVEELEKQKSAAESANLAKSRFLAAASHDLRQPLHAQGLFVEDLRRKITETDALETLSKLETSINALHFLFNSLLDLSKLDAQVIKPKLTSIDVNILFHELKLDFQKRADEKGLEYHCVNSKQHIISDKILLMRLLRNLVSNAIEHTSTGKILIGCRRKGKKVLIQIWDTGPGIPEREKDLIFEEYYQLNNPERDRNKGVGLGLAIVSRIAKLLNHDIKICSNTNKGSVFSICLPVTEPELPGMRLEEQYDITTKAHSNNSMHKTVLVVDDDLTILNGMTNLLQSWECTVIACSSMADVLTKINTKSTIDLIIADLRLPQNVTGIDVIKKVKEILKKDVPSFIVTGDTSLEKLQQLSKNGIHVLHKPLAPAKLRSLITFHTTQNTSTGL